MSFPKAPFQSIISDATSKVYNVWQQWFDRIQITLNAVTGSGTTANRPTQNLYLGQPYFDTDLNQTVVWDGSQWVSAGGTAVTAVLGDAPIESSGGTTPVISITQAGAASNGYLSSTDWSTFNSKGSGDVVGPALSTDNAISRYDGVTGKRIQNSAVTLDDNSNVAGARSLSFSGLIPASIPTGTMWFEGSTNTLNLKQNNITQQVGEEIYIYGRASESIVEGQVIAVSGAWGTTGVVKFEPAPIGTTDASTIIGIATEAIAKNSFGRITAFGTVHDLSTSPGFADGDVIYYDPTVLGGYTKTIPTAPNIKCQVGIITKAAGGTNGSIQVKVLPGSTLGGTDSNVNFVSLANNDLIQYNASLGYWTNIAPGTVTNVASAAKWTTARLLAGNSVDGSANVPFANKFIVQGTADAGLTGAQFLGALGTGLVKNTTTTGVLSIAVAGTDYAAANATFTLGSTSIALGGTTTTVAGLTLTNPTINGFTGNTAVINIGSGQIYKDTSGNVGIGTDAPSAKVVIVGSTTGAKVLGLGGTAAFLQTTSVGVQDWSFGTRTTGRFVFNAGNALGGTDVIALDSAGNTYIITGTLWQYAPGPTSKAAAATLTVAELKTGIINTTGTTYTVTLPTGTAIDAGFTGAPTTNIGFDFYVVNTAAGIITIAVNTGVTSLGTLTVATGVSAHFRLRRTAANTYVVYRLS